MRNPISIIVFLLAAIAAFLVVDRTGLLVPRGDYAYRCSDGTEFSMTPADDGMSITLYPSSGADKIPQATLALAESEFGTRFESAEESLVFHGQGETVQLIGKSFSTTCKPVANGDNAPYNWGD